MIAGHLSVPAIKAFCVGQAKSGTASLASLLAANHRAGHEPEREQILDGHINRGTWSDRIESLVDQDYLVEMVRSICNDNLALYFPEVTSVEDAYQLWKPQAEDKETP